MKLKRSRLTKAEFLTLISSDDVWLRSMSESNIRNGYRACGIFPVDREAYPKQRFSPKLLERYETWLKGEQPHKNLKILKKKFFSWFYAEFIQD